MTGFPQSPGPDPRKKDHRQTEQETDDCELKPRQHAGIVGAERFRE
jgi:hypothetical protein